MPTLRVVNTIPWTTGLPEDIVQNTFHVHADLELSTSQLEELTNAFGTFYQAIDQYLAPVLSPTVTTTVYDLSDPEPRVVIHEDSRALTLSTQHSIPEEVALCLSFQALPVAGQNQRRRRGRVYIGPLSLDAGTVPDSKRYVPNTALITALTQAAEDLSHDLNDVAEGSVVTGQPINVYWVVYSQVGGTVSRVEEAWVDNAWDTQRRRGRGATARTTNTFDLPVLNP